MRPLILLILSAAAPASPLSLPLTMVQFADLHYGEAEALDWGPEQDTNSTRVMLVVFSGDQLTGNNVATNATSYSRVVYDEAVQRTLPFASIFGNHDDAPLETLRTSARSSSATSRRALLAFEREAWPTLSLTCGEAGDDGCPSSLSPSVSNYFLLLRNATGAPRAVLFFLDSGGGDFGEELFPSVTAWLASTAAALAAAHGPLPSITFVHIPPSQYVQASSSRGCVGLADDGITPTVGSNALIATLAATGNARAVSVGHDHAL